MISSRARSTSAKVSSESPAPRGNDVEEGLAAVGGELPVGDRGDGRIARRSRRAARRARRRFVVRRRRSIAEVGDDADRVGPAARGLGHELDADDDVVIRRGTGRAPPCPSSSRGSGSRGTRRTPALSAIETTGRRITRRGPAVPEAGLARRAGRPRAGGAARRCCAAGSASRARRRRPPRPGGRAG